MPINDIHIFRSANELIKQHGADAAVHAGMRADELLAQGDVDGSAVWKSIVRAINDIMNTDRPAGTPCH